MVTIEFDGKFIMLCNLKFLVRFFMSVTFYLAGAREFVRVSRNGKPDDLLNSAVGGFGAGAILGRLQGTMLLLLTYCTLFLQLCANFCD